MDPLYIAAALVFLFAGTIKGVIGIGMPTLAISILSQITDPRVAISLGLVPIILTNMWQIYRAGEAVKTFKRLWVFAVTLAIVIWLSSGFAVRVSSEAIMLAIGIGVVVFASASLVRSPPALSDKWDRPFQLIGGILGGIMGGLTAIWSPPLVIYLLARRVSKDDFMRAVGLLILVGVVPLTSRYISSGLMTPELILASSAMLIPALTGFSIGERLRAKLSASWFQNAVLIMFLLMGLNLIRQSLF